MYYTCDGATRFIDTLLRYICAAGTYPHQIRLRTPIGMVSPTLYSYHDMLTVNEIFFRRDYGATEGAVVVDVGANIGLSGLYFLTRGNATRCYLFEPVPANVRKLKETLSRFSDRYCLEEVAVDNEAGTCDFGIEPTGRYGGIGRATGAQIRVQCISMNEMLAGVLSREKHIDILKIDTEGTERELIEAIAPEHRSRVRRIFYEGNDGRVAVIEANGAKTG
jgi:FkbM family methyltransferase